mmetsp:Transcript_8809/g.16804  ORF Transcript_8809/g.16804 Transcript_8809/m.16804 type:complete len:249 (+) Transcript_8809:243-989(+)
MGSRPSSLGTTGSTTFAAPSSPPASPPALPPDVDRGTPTRRTGGHWAVRRNQAYAAGLPDGPVAQWRLSSRAATPSTFTPASGSRGLSSLASSPEIADSGDGSEAACSDGFDAAISGGCRGGSTPELRLSQARQHANDSLEALRMELMGFGGAVAVRYASWPIGAAVEVLSPVGQGGSEAVAGQLVRYDPGSTSFEVRLRDGKLCMVPAQQVRRVSGAIPLRSPHAGFGLGRPLIPAPGRARTPELLS